MGKNFKYAALSLLCLFIFCCKKIEGKNSPQPEKHSDSEIKAMINNFYDAYITAAMSTAYVDTLEQRLDSVKHLYCTNKLIDGLDTKFEKEKLKYDPYTNTKYYRREMLPLVINKAKDAENKYFAMYTDNDSDNKSLTLVLLIGKDKTGYKITSITALP